MSHIYPYLIGIVGVLLTFGTAVCVHEFGHMIFALMRGVGVEAFAIGMGPKFFAWKWKDIEFSLRILPIGGFVKLQGMSETELIETVEPTPDAAAASSLTDEEVLRKKTLAESATDDMAALENKGFITKILVFGGGVFMNFVTAIVVMAVLLWLPQDFPRQSLNVEYVEPASAPALAGIASGDSIMAFDGAPVTYQDELFDQIRDKVAAQSGADAKASAKASDKAAASAPVKAEAANGAAAEKQLGFTLGVERDGTRRDVKVAPMPASKIGAFFGSPVGDAKPDLEFRMPAVLDQVFMMMPARTAKLKSGDQIIAVAGQPVSTGREVKQAIKRLGVVPVEFTIKRGAETFKSTITPQSNPLDREQPLIGVSFASPVVEQRRVYDNPLLAIAHAPGATVSAMADLVALQVKFFRNATGKELRQGLGGPIAIIGITANYAQEGLNHALNWFLTLNLLLIIFNLLPIPVLDGGAIALALIEAVMRRPVPPKLLNAVYTVATYVLIAFVLFVSYNDIMRHF